MDAPIFIGWRECISLPKLGIRLKAKVDTGARTSALHACSVKIVKKAKERKKVCFEIRLNSRHSPKKIIKCTARLIGIREVTDSGGHKEQRCVIKTPVIIGKYRRSIEITLTSRDNMRFKMLLGRTALKPKKGKRPFVINPNASYLLSKKHPL